jgi:hypothetical protein
MPFYSLSSSGGGGGLVEAATFAALPATGATGTLYVVTGTNTLYRWSGSAYVEVSASPAEVVEAANLAAFPATGAAGKIYVALDTGKTYRWGGSAYAEISAGDWATLTNKPSTFAPSAHAASHASGGSDAVTLAVSQVTGLQTALDGKAADNHSHVGNDLTIYNVDGDYPATIGDTNVESFLWNVSIQSLTRTGLAARQAINRGLIGAAAASHTHEAGDIASGTIATARLASGTASASTFLRGDQTWVAIAVAAVSGLQTALDAKAAYAQVSTYAAMVALGTPAVLTTVKVTADENKGATNTVYQLWPNGSRLWIAAVAE